MSEHAELVQQFLLVTGANEDRARFFLESSNWQLEVALSSFYENGGAAEAAEAAPEPIIVPSDDESPSSSPPPAPRMVSKEKSARSGGAGGRIMTLGTLAQDESSSDEEEGQAFYAGGSERSGQQILGPQRADLVAEMFRSIRAHGAVADDEAPDTRQKAFAGTGYRLGQAEDDHVAVSSATATATTRSVRLRMYREGFTVDDGALRLYTEPENASFLHFISRGEVPPELGARREVRVNIEDRRNEPAPTSRTKAQSFAGQGYVLGSPAPPTVGVTAPVASSTGDREANERAAKAALHLDESEPATTIQIRLADGGRLVGRFNLTHTVQHIRDYITTALPEYQLRDFLLLTTFPNAELKTPTATIAEAKLQNSVVVQRLV